MTRAAWIELGAFLCVVSLWLGLGAAFLIDDMEWAAVVGTVPTWVFLVVVRIGHRKMPVIEDVTREWFV